jgi:hypothetical protein
MTTRWIRIDNDGTRDEWQLRSQSRRRVTHIKMARHSPVSPPSESGHRRSQFMAHSANACPSQLQWPGQAVSLPPSMRSL